MVPVVVALVKIAVEAVVAPMAELLIVTPEMTPPVMVEEAEKKLKAVTLPLS